MERVFAKYEKVKKILERLIEEKDSKMRKLLSEGAVHIFDAENQYDEDSSPVHRLNLGVYSNASAVEVAKSSNTFYFDHNLPEDVLSHQFNFLTNSDSGLLDVAFSLDKDKFDEFKKNIHELKKIEQVLKKVHFSHVPLRKHHFNNLKFFSKYLVGESVGGDYFDIEEVDKKIYFFLASFNSYVTSVNFIKSITDIKNKGERIFSETCDYIEEIGSDIKGIFLMEIDPRKLDLNYFSLGDFYLKSTTSSFKARRGSHMLSEGESLVIGSSGFKELTTEFRQVENSCLNNDKEVYDFYNEYFSFLNTRKTGRFLPKDATLISLIVKNNLIKEVE